jgi:Holliday junction resolvase RusA-like endonuclease
MTFSLTFHIHTIPVPKGRPKFSKIGGFVRTYTPKKTQDFEIEVREAAKQAMTREPLETPLAVYLYFRLPIPKSYPKKRIAACLAGSERPTKKPDLDNLAKSVLDALNGVIYQDDSQIVSLHMTKVYSQHPGIDLLIREQIE